MAKVKKYQRGGCLSTTGSGTRIKMYKQAAGEGSSDRMYRKEARQAARAERKEARVEKRAAKNAPEAKYGKKVKKAQSGGAVDPKVAEFLKKRQAADTSKPYNQEEMFARMNKQIMAEMKNPKLGDERRRREDSTNYSNWQKDSTSTRKWHKEEGNLAERRPDGSMKYTVMPKKKSDGFKKGGKLVKKAKSGGSFPDLNKDGKITKADILKGRGVIKNGAALKKQAAKAINIKKIKKSIKKK
jgi:hypothetical protein